MIVWLLTVSRKPFFPWTLETWIQNQTGKDRVAYIDWYVNKRRACTT